MLVTLRAPVEPQKVNPGFLFHLLVARTKVRGGHLQIFGKRGTNILACCVGALVALLEPAQVRAE